MNVPYVKKYENRLLVNPIEKEFLNSEPNRKQRRTEFKQRAKNNTQGRRCIVTKIGVLSFVRYVGYDQVIRTYGVRGEKNKTIQHLRIIN